MGQQGAVVAFAGGGLDVVDVAGDARDALQAALAVDEPGQLLGAHPVVFHQVDHHRRVDAAGAAGHDQAVGGRHAHRGVDGAAVVDGAQGGADAQVAGDDLELAERPLEHLGGLQGDVAVGAAVEAVAADAFVLVQLVGQAVEVGVGRQGLVEGGVEDRHVGHAGQALHGDPDAVEVDRVVQRGEHRQGLDLADHLRGDHHRAGELAAAMHDPVAHRGDLFGVEGEGAAEELGGFLHHLEQLGQREGVAHQLAGLGAHAHRDVGGGGIGGVDDAVHVGAQVAGVVDAEMDLAEAHVEGQHLARGVAVQRQGVGVVRLGRAAGLGVEHVGGEVAHAVEEQARQIGDRLRVGQHVGAEHLVGHQQHEAAGAGDHVGGEALAGQRGHHAEHVALVELADHDAAAGLVGHRDLGVAAHQDAHVFALVAGLEDRLVAFKGRQLRLGDDQIDLVGREVLEEANFFEEEFFQVNFTHGLTRVVAG